MASNSNYRPVLILRASPRISVAIARSLDCRGIPVEVAVSLGDDHQVNLPAIHALHRLSSRDQYPAQFLHSLLGLIRERDFDMVLPVNGPALCALGENYETLAPVLHLGCSAAIVVECVLNKAVTLEAAQKCGIKVPVTGTIDSFAELASSREVATSITVLRGDIFLKVKLSDQAVVPRFIDGEFLEDFGTWHEHVRFNRSTRGALMRDLGYELSHRAEMVDGKPAFAPS